jgi:hypothetical protein
MKKRKTKKRIKVVVIDDGVHAELKAWCAKRGMKVGVAAGAFISWAIGLAEEQTNVASSAVKQRGKCLTKTIDG